MESREITVSFPLCLHGKEPMDVTGRVLIEYVNEGNLDAPDVRVCSASFTKLIVNGQVLSPLEQGLFEELYQHHYMETLEWLAQSSAA